MQAKEFCEGRRLNRYIGNITGSEEHLIQRTHSKTPGTEMTDNPSSPTRPGYLSKIETWQKNLEERKRTEQRQRQEQAAERNKRNAERRKIADAERKREERREAAKREGRTLRHRTDCSNMTPQEKADHVRGRERRKKQRQRVLKELEGDLEELNGEELDELLRDLPGERQKVEPWM